MSATSADTVFQYSKEFEGRIEALCAEKRDWPHYRQYVADHLGSENGRYALFKRETLPEIEYHCGALSNQVVLDFGCGTGASTAALAERAKVVIAFDTDARRVALCRMRLQEHGLEDRVTFVSDQLPRRRVDLAVLNGVIEHIPATEPGLRESVLSQVARAVGPGGHIFINDTPNRLCPVDLHTTRLWWIPWTRPGSSWAYARALAAGRFFETPGSASGPRGLEEAGAWGTTFWALDSCLKKHGFSCLNLAQGHDRRLRYHPARPNARRRIFEALVYPIGLRFLRAPLTAFMPNLNNLVFRRSGADAASPPSPAASHARDPVEFDLPRRDPISESGRPRSGGR